MDRIRIEAELKFTDIFVGHSGIYNVPNLKRVKYNQE